MGSYTLSEAGAACLRMLRRQFRFAHATEERQRLRQQPPSQAGSVVGRLLSRIYRRRALSTIPLPKLNDAQQVDLLLDALEKSALYHERFEKEASEHPLLSEKVVEDLRLIQGPKTAPREGLVQRLLGNKAGFLERLGVAYRLVRPTKNLEKLQKRQKVLAYLQKKPDVMQHVLACYQKIQEKEANLLSLQSTKDPFWSPTTIALLHTLTGRKTTTAHANTATKKDLKLPAPIWISLVKFFQVDVQLLYVGAIFIGSVVAFFLGVSGFLAGGASRWYDWKGGLVSASLLGMLVSCVYLFFFYARYRVYNYYRTYFKARFEGVKQFLCAFKALVLLVDSDPVLSAHAGHHLRYTRQLLIGGGAPATKSIQQAQAACAYMMAYNYNQGVVGRFFGNWFHLIKLFFNNRSIFKDMFWELIEVSDLLKSAQLLRPLGDGASVAYHLPLYEQGNKTPFFKAKGLWNPDVDPSQAVTNNLEVASSAANLLVVMGANGSGKSQVTAALFKAVLMGQTLGVVPGQLEMSIMEAFYTFKEPQEDPAVKESLFMQELRRIEGFLQISKENKRVLLLIDEFIGSTDLVSSAVIQVSFLNWLMANRAETVALMSSHHPQVLSILNKSPRAILYHSETHRGPNGDIKPLYTIKKGLKMERLGVDIFERVIQIPRLIEAVRRYDK